MLKIILFVGLFVCLNGASWMIAVGISILNTYLEDVVKERRKSGKTRKKHHF